MKRLPFLVAALVAAGAAIAPSAHPAHADADPPAAPVSIVDPAGRAVVGIVCDNLGGAPRADFLSIRSDTLQGAQVLSAALTNPDDSAEDQDGAPNTGSLLSAGDSVTITGNALTYFPPDEFNPRQQPQSPQDLLGPATRTVHLHARILKDGGTYALDQDLTLARPAVALVHGINSGPENWNPFIAAITGGIGVHAPFVALNHFAPHQSFPQGLARGNGPVEIGGKLLKALIGRTLDQIHAGQPITDSGENAGEEVHSFLDYAGLPLSAVKVDVVAWSYGGVIARWYLASAPGAAASFPRYRGAYPFAIPHDYGYGGDVRKLITLGSMWRGVPLANYVNEARFPPSKGVPQLGNAPVFGITTVKKALDQITDDAGDPIPAKVPSTEVMAIESPWLNRLVYGISAPVSPRPPAQPFLPGVGYAAIGGDDYRYLQGSDVYDALNGAQTPSWFPYLAVEHLLSGIHGVTDGVVPLWSSLLPESATLVPATHGGYLTDPVTQSAVATLLNSDAVPPGSVLTGHWLDPVSAADGFQQWTFSSETMAPLPASELYLQNKGVGRINPSALRECFRTERAKATSTTTTVSWKTAATSTGRIRILTAAGGAPLPPAVIEGAATRNHSATLTGLRPNTAYTYELTFTLGDGVTLTSPPKKARSFRTKP